MRKTLLGTLTAIGTACALAAPIAAAEVKIEGKVELNALSVTGFVKGQRYVIDAAYAEKYGREVLAPFEFIGPTAPDQMIYSLTDKLDGTGMIKLFFTTKDKEVKSDIQFVPMTVDMAPIEKRLKALENVVRKAFAQSVPDTKKAKINGMQNTKVGKYPAIEAIGQYVDPKQGIAVLRIVAIPNPESKDGVLVVINGWPKHIKLEKVSDILKTEASRALGTFKYQ